MNETELKRIWGILSSKFNMSNFTYDMFKQNMSNVEGRKKFWGKYSKDLKLDDYNLYEKNLTTNQTSTQGALISPNTTPPKPAQTVDSSVFNCIKNSNTKGKNLQQTKDNPEAYSFFNTDGSEFTFWANGDFTYYDGDTTANGKWKCKGGNNFEANVDWKGTTHYFKSETNEWALTQNAKKTFFENTIKKIVSKNLKSLTK